MLDPGPGVAGRLLWTKGGLCSLNPESEPSLQVGGRWTAGQPVPFELLADTFEAISETSKRLDIVNLLVGGGGVEMRCTARANILLELDVDKLWLVEVWHCEGRRVGDLPLVSSLCHEACLWPSSPPCANNAPLPLRADQLLPGHPGHHPRGPVARRLSVHQQVGEGDSWREGVRRGAGEHSDCADPSSQSALSSSSRVAPAHHGIELGIGEGILFKVRGICTTVCVWSCIPSPQTSVHALARGSCSRLRGMRCLPSEATHVCSEFPTHITHPHTQCSHLPPPCVSALHRLWQPPLAALSSASRTR